MPNDKKFDRIGDDAVKTKTEKSWKEWFSILDKAGSKRMNHKEIAIYLKKRYSISAWWSQMVTEAYERDRGLRKKYQKPDGYEISRSKTIAVPIRVLFSNFYDKKKRDRWLGKEKILIRKSSKDKFIRITWSANNTNLEVNFYEKEKNKSQVVVQHGRLSDIKNAEEMKVFWKGKLEKLKQLLQG